MQWLIFFYSVPSKPVSNRVKIWRKLSKAGALQLKGAVYILPMNEEHHEFCQWLVSEVESMGGQAAFTSAVSIDSMKDAEIIELFKQQIGSEYVVIEKTLNDIETVLNSYKKGSGAKNINSIQNNLSRAAKLFEDARRKDFFSSRHAIEIDSKIRNLKSDAGSIIDMKSEKRSLPVSRRTLSEYQGKIWVSRKRPFVDKMASAWLIRRFIDRRAVFELVDEKGLESLRDDRITFDVADGDFTHAGDLCTFETLQRAFGLKDTAIKKLAEIVHELDIKDDKYSNEEARGIEEIIIGIRKTSKTDIDALESGIAVFEMLYASKSKLKED